MRNLMDFFNSSSGGTLAVPVVSLLSSVSICILTAEKESKIEEKLKRD
jgi:hypothetical protein